MLKTLQLKCRFCSKITGEYKYPDNLTVADLGIADVRCEQHEQEFGSYKKMHDEFLQDIGNHDEFLTIIKKVDYKKDNFDKEVEKIKTAMLEPVLGNSKLRKVKKSGIIKKK